MQADVDLHQGLPDCAADRFDQQVETAWFRSPYFATRAEAYARLGRKDADEAIATAEASIGEHRYARGILLRAKAIRSGDDAPLLESLALFAELDCPYQAARSGWLLEGKDREEARLTFLGLGATQPA
jgi:hypothetical protein